MNCKNIIIKIITLSLICAVIGCSLYNGEVIASDNEKDTVEVVFTHDLHSFVASYTSCYEGKVQEVGGFARLSSFIKERREDNQDILLIDGGDLCMGTLYQTLYYTDALELRLLGQLGYDATTFGNHDFDYDEEKLVQMFNVAADNSDYLPAYVICNVDWTADNDATREIYEAVSRCNLCEYTMVEKNGVNIAIIGVFGQVATSDSPTLELTILDQVESVRNTVEVIKANEDADMIVCISHSGTDDDIKKSEDEILAKEVPELDLILSAHSHTLLDEYIQHGNTYIVSCGCYGMYTGDMVLSRNDAGRWDITDYRLVPMTEDMPEDQEIVNLTQSYNDSINENYLAQFGLQMDDVIARSNHNFATVEEIYYDHTDHDLGDLMSDAYRYAVNNTNYGKEHPADIAVVPAGTVRGTFYTGNITTKDVFQCYSMGIGYDGEVGFPIVQFYLTGDEVRMIPEIDATLSSLMVTATLYCSGISYTAGSCRMPLNKAYNIVLNPTIMDDSTDRIDGDRLYSVVTDLYTARMIGAVSRLSKGLIKIEPKYSDGRLLESEDGEFLWENIVVYEDDGTELKAWYAIADYLLSFEKDQDGVSIIPDYYSEEHNRKVTNDSLSLKTFFRETNKYFWMLSGIILVFTILLVLIIRGVVKAISGIFGKMNSVKKGE